MCQPIGPIFAVANGSPHKIYARSRKIMQHMVEHLVWTKGRISFDFINFEIRKCAEQIDMVINSGLRCSSIAAATSYFCRRPSAISITFTICNSFNLWVFGFFVCSRSLLLCFTEIENNQSTLHSRVSFTQPTPIHSYPKKNSCSKNACQNS